MKISRERILTTHVGSLPRPAAAVDLLLRKERGELVDAGEFDRTIKQSVAEMLAWQSAIGLDVVSDGEVSKIGYSTYIKDRFSGFGGEFTPKPHLDLADYPEFRKRMVAFLGPQTFKRMYCVGPVSVKDGSQLKHDVENFGAALAGAKVVEGFLNAASPGVVSAFQRNQYYPSHEAYIEALANALREEYEAIVGAGFVLQVDCPDIAMSRHTGFQELTEAEFLKRAAFDVEALNHALAKVPAEMVRIHEGPSRRPAAYASKWCALEESNLWPSDS